MQIRNSELRYGLVAMTLHWVIAALIVGMFALGQVMTAPPPAERDFALYQLHKSFGFVVLALVVVRLAWRWMNPQPPLPPTLKPYERGLARATHAALYALIIALPLSGWLMVSASPWQIPTVVFGVVPVPHLLGPDGDLEALFKTVHAWLGWALVAVVVLHVAGALKHHFVLRDDVLRRMLPGASAARPPGAS